MQQSSITPQAVINAYINLGSSCKQSQRLSNIFLMKIMNQPEVWLISQDLLRQEKYSSHRLLGAQLFYRKLERDIRFFQKSVLQQLKKFVFSYLQLNHKKPSIRRLLAAAYTLIIGQLSNQHIKQFFSEVLDIMKKPNGTILALSLIKQFPIEIQNTNSLPQPRKHELLHVLMQQKPILEDIFLHLFCLQEYQEQSIEACQLWVNYGFSLIQSSQLVKHILEILKAECEHQLFVNACSLLSRTIQVEKTLSLRNFKKFYEASDFNQQIILSLQYLTSFFEQIQFYFDSTAQYQNSKLQSLLNIIYKLLINFQFLLKLQRGSIFQKIILGRIKNKKIATNVAVCHFTQVLIENILKIQIQQLTEEFLSKLFEFLSEIMSYILPQCVTMNIHLLQSQSSLDETFDQADEQNRQFYQLRKCISETLISHYKLYTFKSQLKGSQYFINLISTCISFIHHENPIKGLDLSIFVMKSLLKCSNFCLYWGQFFNSFLQSLIKDFHQYCRYNGLVQQIFQMIHGCEFILNSKELASKVYKFLSSFLNNDNSHKESIKCLKNMIKSSSKTFIIKDFQDLQDSYKNSKDIFSEYSNNLLQCSLICITRLSQPDQMRLSMFNVLLETIKCQINDSIHDYSPRVKQNLLISLKTLVVFCVKQQNFLSSSYGTFLDQTITLCYSTYRQILTGMKLPEDQINYILAIEQQVLLLQISFNLLPYLASKDGFSHLFTIFDVIFRDFIDRFEQRSFSFMLINILSKGFIKLHKQRNQEMQSWLMSRHDKIIKCYRRILEQVQFNQKFNNFNGLRSVYHYLTSVIIFNKQIYLAEKHHQNDFFLCGLVIFQTISETSIQTQLIGYFKACIQAKVYDSLLDSIFYSLFSSTKLIISSKVSQLLAELLGLGLKRAIEKQKCDIRIILKKIFEFDFLCCIDEGIRSLMVEYFYIGHSKSSLNDQSKPIRELSYILKTQVGANYVYPLKRKLDRYRQSSNSEKDKMEVEK